MVNDRISGVTVGNLLCDMCAANHRVSADGTACLSSTGGKFAFFLGPSTAYTNHEIYHGNLFWPEFFTG